MPDETPPDLAPIKKYTHVGQLLKTDTDKDGKMSAYLHDGPNTPILKPDSTVDQERCMYLPLALFSILLTDSAMQLPHSPFEKKSLR